jgi:ABC-type long-subunit fatty acid transport system fused permease/ATPase subunit
MRTLKKELLLGPWIFSLPLPLLFLIALGKAVSPITALFLVSLLFPLVALWPSAFQKDKDFSEILPAGKKDYLRSRMLDLLGTDFYCLIFSLVVFLPLLFQGETSDLFVASPLIIYAFAFLLFGLSSFSSLLSFLRWPKNIFPSFACNALLSCLTYYLLSFFYYQNEGFRSVCTLYSSENAPLQIGLFILSVCFYILCFIGLAVLGKILLRKKGVHR